MFLLLLLLLLQVEDRPQMCCYFSSCIRATCQLHLAVAGKADMCLLHAKVGAGGLLLDDTLMLIDLKTDLSTDAKQVNACPAWLAPQISYD